LTAQVKETNTVKKENESTIVITDDKTESNAAAILSASRFSYPFEICFLDFLCLENHIINRLSQLGLSDIKGELK